MADEPPRSPRAPADSPTRWIGLAFLLLAPLPAAAIPFRRTTTELWVEIVFCAVLLTAGAGFWWLGRRPAEKR